MKDEDTIAMAQLLHISVEMFRVKGLPACTFVPAGGHVPVMRFLMDDVEHTMYAFGIRESC